MTASTNKQAGMAHLVALVVAVVLAGIGAGAYLVYERQQMLHSSQQSAASPTPAVAENQPSDSSTAVSETVYSKVPTGLQSAILAETKSTAPHCVAGGRIVDYDKKPYDQPITYKASGYAFTVIGCDGRAQYLFVRQIGGWTAAEHTQLGFSCKTLQQYNVPTDLVAANDPTASNHATCLDESGSEVTYMAP